MPAAAAAAAAPHISLTAAAAALGVSRHRVLSLTVAGLLPAHPIAGRVFYARADVAKLATALRATPGSEK